ncbi:MbcA/ParS/Xre antitoxin family protein [Azohydromonas aeria]|uniref:MbcA/ParS/Xre antitoxin family protein n=1 Tax=Azohydromonas aeria TaxID=2590212 RepID=UPI0012F8120A|nr:MbcA/ParS/Xre antitoxin family protein [Azohydromonas aeria]
MSTPPIAADDAAARTAAVRARAIQVFESETAALSWLASPNGALGGAIPDSLAGSLEGTAAVLETLGRIEHGVFS